MWMELGLRALARTPLAEGEKVEVLLLLSGYTFSFARLSATAADGVQRGYFDSGEEAPAFAGLLRQLAGPDRFPALLGGRGGRRLHAGDGRSRTSSSTCASLLDGVDALVRRKEAGDA